MRIRSIRTTPRFERSFAKLPLKLQKSIVSRKEIFASNPFSPVLKTHKLGGKLKGLWSFSVSFSHRIIFEFLDNKSVIFYDIGDHSIYR